MAKSIPAKEFKEAMNDLNKILGKNKIKIVGVKKVEVIEQFTDSVLDFIDNGKDAELPDSVINVYNTYIANEEGEEDEAEEKPVAKEKHKKKTTKTGKSTFGSKIVKKRTVAEKAKGSAKKTREPGVVALAVKAYMEDGLTTTNDIAEALEKKFPGRNIRSTISNVVCVLHHVEK